MKKILFSILFIGISLAGLAQGSIPVWGHWNYKFLTVDSAFAPPHYTTANRPAPGGKIQFIVNDDSAKLQYTVGSSWVTLNGTAGGGTLTPGYGIKIVSTTITWDSANVRKQDSSWIAGDTLEFRINGGAINKYLVAVGKVKYTDTAAMLAPYIRSILAMKYTDTSSMLSPYLRSILGVKYADTAAMLSPYLRSNAGMKYTDTAAMLSPYAQKIFLNLKLDSITRKPGNDSVFQWHNGTKVFAFLDSISAGGTGCAGCLLAANNLSDVASVATARANLALGTAALQNNFFFLQSANNLSDLANAATARSNLGLGTAAQQANGFFLQSANNLNDIANAATARTNLGLGVIAQRNTLTNADLSGSAGITNANLANSTISGVSLGGNLFSHSVSYGLLGNAFNGTSAQAWSADTASTHGLVSKDYLANYTTTFNARFPGTGVPVAYVNNGAYVQPYWNIGYGLNYNRTGSDSTNNLSVDSSSTNGVASKAYVNARIGGGTATPGGSSGDVQWNSAGTLAGGGFTYDNTNAVLNLVRSQNNEVGSFFSNSSTGAAAVAKVEVSNNVNSIKMGIYPSGNSYAITPANSAFLYANSVVSTIFNDGANHEIRIGTGAAITAAQLRINQDKIKINPAVLPTGTTGDSIMVWHAADSALYLVAQSSISGSGSGLTQQTFTSGSTGTVSGSNYVVYIDPTSTLSSFTLTLPASPTNAQIVVVNFGGTLTSGMIVSSLTVLPNSGQSLVDNTPPGSATADNTLEYRYRLSNTTWYRFKP